MSVYVTASCRGEDFIQQSSQWHSLRCYFRHLCCGRRQQAKLRVQSRGNSAFVSCCSAAADPVHLRASRWGGPCSCCAGGPTARFLSPGRRQPGLSLGVCAHIHVQEGSSEGAWCQGQSLEGGHLICPLLLHTSSCAYFCPRMPWLVSCPSRPPSSVSFSVMVINSNPR